LALSHLYQFAGKYRDVNISKGGFPFAAAKFLPFTMQVFEDEFLINLPTHYSNNDDLIRDISRVHGELLFIHPFREGNGRTARILANLMAAKQGHQSLRFDKIDDKTFPLYVSAVQDCAKKEYTKMEELIRSIFPD
jgi:cell filamentation protein